jgi:folate-dependent phosphoribosylglycinamide formyltransferase PurN
MKIKKIRREAGFLFSRNRVMTDFFYPPNTFDFFTQTSKAYLSVTGLFIKIFPNIMERSNAPESLPRILIFGSGTPTGGGSGPRMLVDNVKSGVLKARIAGLVTHYPDGGVAALGKENEDLFRTFLIEGFPTRKKGEKFSQAQLSEIREIYATVIDSFRGYYGIQYVLLSGWMKLVLGLPVGKVVNIHPSRVDRSFGGEGKYGDSAHQYAFEEYRKGNISHTAITMHFVDEEFDHGPVIAQQKIALEGCATWEEAKDRVVGPTEHRFQLAVTKALLEGNVALRDGKAVWMEGFEFENPEYVKGSIRWE